MNNYKLIHNQEALDNFVDFLPELKSNEGYFIILVARLKWFPESNIPSAVKLKRETLNKKSNISRTIKQWETEIGTYLTKDNIVIPQNNLGVYIGYNPKDHHKAIFELMKECLNVIQHNRQNIHIKSMANDIIQTSNGSKNFLDIDVDIKENENYMDIVNFITNIIDKQCLTFVKTSGGFHCLIRLDDMKINNTWYQEIKRHPFKSTIDIFNNDLLPLIGCNQGQFVPYIF